MIEMRGLSFSSLLVYILCCFIPTVFAAETIVPLNSPSWKYRKGNAPPTGASGAWRSVTYADGDWSTGAAPFHYGENLAGGTPLTDMRNSYTTLFLRHLFVLTNPTDAEPLVLKVRCDDGFILWINGKERVRYNVADGEPLATSVSRSSIEPVWVTNVLAGTAGYLAAGTNVVAIQVFNQALNSSDLVMDASLEMVSDKSPPLITSVSPVPGEVAELTTITVTFSEPVSGVDATDLLVNNTPATRVIGTGSRYTFEFAQPSPGVVDLTWDDGHHITDTAAIPLPFDAGATSAVWRYQLADRTRPVLLATTPPAGSTVKRLFQVEVRFSEPVRGVDASDLLAGGRPSSKVILLNPSRYLFEFSEQPPGTISISWSASHGIQDESMPPNSFTAGSWTVVVDPAAPTPKVVISEFLASADAAQGLRDEDGELQDWIELHNAAAIAAQLGGWSLSDDRSAPDLWVFPEIWLDPGARLVVFASGKDRRTVSPGAKLHTNFKLNAAGEFLALFGPELPRVAATEFNQGFPEQRTDISHGLDGAGEWRYFSVPTPGSANATAVLAGVVPKPRPSMKRGLFDEPISLTLTNEMAGITIRYTLDGSVPTASTGQLYSSPIRIETTRVLRAAAFRQGFLPSEIITHTYVLIPQTMVQPENPPGFPTGPTVMAGYPADYAMDPEIVNGPAYKADMAVALRALPTLSVAMNVADMFGAANGIYTHPLNRGPQWERACSVEFIPASNGVGLTRQEDDFQENAGIQVQGNAAREPIKQPKHPLRVVFKGDYGKASLSYRMFPDSPVQQFDTLVLRADFNVSWLHWNPAQRIRGQRTRDAWMKDSMRAMGGLASHNRYVHLYVNGLYWGIYEPSERPDGSFGAAYLGGQKEDYDVINEGAVVDGSATAYNAMLALTGLQDPARYAEMKSLLDMDQFIDYMLLHFYGGHEDWGNNKNWYTVRPKNGSSGFKYVPWDGELILGDPGINRVANADVPSGLHTKLLANADYRLSFADRVHRHFFNDGALTPQNTAERWMIRARQIELPIIAESARWGDYRRDVHQYSSGPYELYTRDIHWRAEQKRLLTAYFPSRTATVLGQLRAAGLYPAVEAPVFSNQDGLIQRGYPLGMTTAAGSIYFTTDGSDPRVPGSSAIAPSARRYAAPWPIDRAMDVKARVLNNGVWSALNTASYVMDALRVPLRITEIMYHPDPASDAFEFIEVQNTGAAALDVSGFSFAGIEFVFPPRSVLEPGQVVVIASGADPVGWRSRYPGVGPVGYFRGQLRNEGERIALAYPDGVVITAVEFGRADGWPESAAGQGYSLELIDAAGDPQDPFNWRSSDKVGGSPSVQLAVASIPPRIAFSEIAAAMLDEIDWIEFWNPGTASVDVGGWQLQQAGSGASFRFADGITVAAGERLRVVCGRSLSVTDGRWVAPFGLAREGESLRLLDAQGVVVDRVAYGPQARGYTLGKIDGIWQLCVPTPLAANQAVALGKSERMVLNEWLANPISGASDWIEVFNSDPELPVALRGHFLQVGAQLHEFLRPTFIEPGGFLQLMANQGSRPDSLGLKLPAEGAEMTLLSSSGGVLSRVVYGPQLEDVSQGRIPDGAPTVVSFPGAATPGAANSLEFPLRASLLGGLLQLEWQSSPGARYRVESTDRLEPASWTLLQEVVAEPGSSSDTLIFNQAALGSRRFFRLGSVQK